MSLEQELVPPKSPAGKLARGGTNTFLVDSRAPAVLQFIRNVYLAKYIFLIVNRSSATVPGSQVLKPLESPEQYKKWEHLLL